MRWTRLQGYMWACTLGCVWFGGAGCRQQLTSQQVEHLLQEQSPNRFVTSRFNCREGEGDWEFICQARYEPTALTKPGALPSPQKIGVRTIGHYRGTPQFAQAILPDQGPVPSIEALTALRQKEAAEAAERSKQRLAKAQQ